MPEGTKEIAISKGKPEQSLRPVNPFEEMERVFESFWRNPLRPFGGWPRALTGFMTPGPNVDILDQDDEVVVRAEVPGFRKEDIELWMSGNTLTVRGARREERKQEAGSYFRAEISHDSFSRLLTLPAEVDESKATASLKDGMLELVLPKLEKSRRRPIKID